MSLTMCVVQKNFIIATSDSAVVYFDIDEEKLQKEGEITFGKMNPTDKVSKKTHLLSNRVVLLATGSSFLTEIMKVELAEKVKESTDLRECSRIAQDILKKMKKGEVENIDKVLKNLSKELNIEIYSDFEKEMSAILSKTGDKVNLSLYLAGFNEDGTAGLVDVIADRYMEPNENGAYPVVIAGHIPGLEEAENNFVNFQKFLSLPVEQRTILNFVNALILVHGAISNESPINVSSDCTLHFLIKDGEVLDYETAIIDTSGL